MPVDNYRSDVVPMLSSLHAELVRLRQQEIVDAPPRHRHQVELASARPRRAVRIARIRTAAAARFRRLRSAAEVCDPGGEPQRGGPPASSRVNT